MKRKYVLNKVKLSNVDIFENRIKERKLFENESSLNLKVNLNKTNNYFNSTLSTFPSTKRTALSSNKKKKTKGFININNNDYYLKTNSFYLTETNLKKKLTPNKNDYLRLSNSKSNKEFFFNDKILLLRNFEEEKKKNLFCLKKKTKYEIKSNKINTKKESSLDYINKTREIILLNYTSNIKKESSYSLRETFKNKIEELNENCKSVENAIYFSNKNFFSTFNEYVKFLLRQKKIEKKYNNNLLRKIFKLKNENSLLESKIKKNQIDKSNILKWLYLQILIFEKKFVIPDYYKNIIEQDEYHFNLMLEEKTKKNSDLNLIKIKNTQRQFFSNLINNNNNNNNNLKRKSESFFYKKKFERMDSRKKLENNVNNINNDNEPYSYLKNISKKEMKRIRDYKYFLKYLTYNDILEQFKQYENESLNLLIKKENIMFQIKELEKEEKHYFIENKEELELLNNSIEKKEKELKILKLKNENLKKEKNQLKITIKNYNIKEEDYNVNIPYKKNKSKLYLYIYNIYQICLQINLKINEEEIKTNFYNQEEEMIYYLIKIELFINYLLSKKKSYKNGNLFFQYKEIQNKIEKNHKIINAKKQREKENLRLEKVKKEIENRNNKIYFLHKKKYEKYYAMGVKKEMNKNNKSKSNEKFNFSDLIY